MFREPGPFVIDVREIVLKKAIDIVFCKSLYIKFSSHILVCFLWSVCLFISLKDDVID